MKKCIAVDLGAESGRIIAGNVSDIEILYRFENSPVKIKENIFWDILSIFKEIKKGLKIAFEKYPDNIESIGIDTWGVDFALLDNNGDLIGNPYHYRDPRTDGIIDEVFKIITKEELYQETGIQLMQINTIFQLYSFFKTKPELAKNAKHFLTIPDLLNYWLTGIMTNEYSIATTTQLFNPVTGKWSVKLLDRLGIDSNIFSGKFISSGTIIGRLLPSVAKETGANPDVLVIAPACHDTGSAVAAVPATGNGNYAYLSSGTWSLFGIETGKPVINNKSLQYNFTNEGGADGGIRLLKNIMGLWILQECKRTWDNSGETYSYDELMSLAIKNGPASFKIDPNDPVFLKSGMTGKTMPDRIKEYCKNTGREIPSGIPEITRGIIESLADAYKKTAEHVKEVTGKEIDELYIIGGGSRNTLLSQLTSEKLKIPVYAGPVEATAIGNILIQMISLGEIKSIAEGRKLIKETYKINVFK